MKQTGMMAMISRFGAMLACALALPALGVNLVSVSDGTTTTEYATIQSALEACSGGETLTLLGNVNLSTAVEISKSVSVNLDGYTLSGPSVQLIKPSSDVHISFRNGTITSGDCCFGFTLSGDYTVSVSNVTFNGVCVLYGNRGTLEFQEGCVARTTLCFVSSYSGNDCACNVRGGVVACAKIYDRETSLGTKLTVYGGSFVADPSHFLAIGYVAEQNVHEALGVSCNYRVREESAMDEAVATVTSAGGETQGYVSFAQAFANCTSGCTLTLMTNCSVVVAVDLAADVVIDLNGYTLSRETSGCLFEMSAGSQGLTVTNGTCTALDVLAGPVQGAGPIRFENCSVEARVVLRGQGDSLTMKDCRVVCDYFVSQGSVGTVGIDGGVYVVRISRSNGLSSAAKFSVSGGRFSFNVGNDLAAGYVQVCEDAVVEGLACRYLVRLPAEGETFPEACVFSTPDAAPVNYATFTDAITSCSEGGRVRLLKNCTVSGTLSIPRSMTLDLNGLRLANGSGNFLQPAANVTLDVDGAGGEIYGPLSLFSVNQARVTVNVTNCTLKGLCSVYGTNGSTVNFRAGTVMADMTVFASGNGSATLNVYDGYYRFSKWRDTAVSTSGTRVHLFGGHFTANPTKAQAANADVLDEHTCVRGENVNFHDLVFPYVVCPDSELAGLVIEAAYEAVVYTNLNSAIVAAASGGGTVSVLTDIVHRVTFPEKNNAPRVTLDLGAHDIAGAFDIVDVGKGRAVDILNGTIRETGSGKSTITVKNDIDLYVGSSVTLAGSAGLNSCGFYIPGGNARVILDGTSVSTTYLVSWGSNSGTSFTVVGDGTNTCNAVGWSGAALPASATFTICGGWWKLNPTSYVTNNHVVLHRANASPCKWQVKPWAGICADGWTFDFADEAPTVTGTCVAPSGPITVSLVGAVPTRKTLLADLSGLTLSSGTYADLSFVKDAALPGAVQVSYENGRLYAWEAKGTLIVFQ